MIPPFEDQTLNRTLSLFVNDLRDILNTKLLSICLYGSALYNDLSPGYGDLDFIVFIGEDLNPNEIELLVKLRAFYRSSRSSNLYTIREQSILLYGESQQNDMPSYSREELMIFLKEYAMCMRKYGKGTSLHSVDWLLLASKFIAWWRQGTILSKSQAADWGLIHLSGGWKEKLMRCKQLRKDPALLTQQDYSEWLSNLEPAIVEASYDLDRALETRSFFH